VDTQYLTQNKESNHTNRKQQTNQPTNSNKNKVHFFIYLCLNNPRANYKISKSELKKGNIHRQKTKEGNWYHLDNNIIAISAAIVQ
jgi:hypothetical protein